MSSRWYGNIMNRLAENSKSPDPVVGMGATELMWSDRHPYEIISVKDARHCDVRELDHALVPGSDWLSGNYTYSSNPEGIVKHLFKKSNGIWVERIGESRREGSKFALGYAEYYLDPSF